MARYKNILVIIGIVISLGIIGAGLTLKKEITILDNESSYHIKTLKTDMEKLLEAHHIDLLETDKVIPSLETALEDGMEIQIVRSFPVEIALGEENISYYTTLLKVGDILDEAGIELNEFDKVYPSTTSTLKGDRKIELVKVEKKTVKSHVVTGYPVVVNRRNELKSATEEVARAGAYGQATEVVEVIYENGVEVGRQLVEWTYESEPIIEKVSKGKEKYLVLGDGKPYAYSKVMDMVSSAYDLSFASCGKYPDHPQYGITYLGTQARPGVVAVDPKSIKLNSKLYVESLDRMDDYGFSSAEDIGSAIKSNRIDLFIENNAQAMRYGVRKVRVYVLEEEFDPILMVGYSR